MDLATLFIWRRNVTQTVSTQPVMNRQILVCNPHKINLIEHKKCFLQRDDHKWLLLAERAKRIHTQVRMIKVAKAALNIFLHWIFNINSRRAQGFNKPLTSFCKDICPYWLKITNILPLPILQYQVEGRLSRGRRLLNNCQVLNMIYNYG